MKPSLEIATSTERVVPTHKLRCEAPRTGLARRNKP
jgi:hypothetical protein